MLDLEHAGDAFGVVTLVDAHGSTPADAGARMAVDADGLRFGTVGGGRIEAKAIGVVQAMLADREATRFVDWSLRADVGMTCGGRVRLFFETRNAATWTVALFGAGHVTQALARVLTALPCRVLCIDPRADWLAKLPPGVQARELADPQAPDAEIDALPDRAAVLCMTRGHATDLPILRHIFATGRRFDHLGVIGSDAKAATLTRELKQSGIDPAAIDFECPMGLPIGTNHPGEIAISITARLLQARDATRGGA